MWISATSNFMVLRSDRASAFHVACFSSTKMHINCVNNSNCEIFPNASVFSSIFAFTLPLLVASMIFASAVL